MRKLYLVVLALILVACAQEESSDDKVEVFTIGAVLSMTGQNSDWGANTRDGIELAVEIINAQGGILGRELEVTYEDSQASARHALAGATRLADVANVPVVIGDVMSANCKQIAPFLESRQIVNINFCVAPELSEAGDYIFRNWTSAGADAATISSFANGKRSKVVILYQNDAFGISSKNEFLKRLGPAKAVEPEFSFNKGEKDFRTTIARLQELEYDAIYMASYYQEALDFLTQYVELGQKEIDFYGVSEWEDARLADFVATNLPGRVFYALPLPPDPSTSARSAFLDGFRAKYDRDPDGILYDNGYDAVLQIVEAIKIGQSFHANDIKNALYSVVDFPGASGTMSFDKNGDVQKPFALRQITAEGPEWLEVSN